MESAPELKLEPNEEPVVGALIQEKYRLILRLAASPNHIVFRAVDETIQKEVVLKFLAKEVVATPDRRARLEREGLLLERVATCPFIVALKANESRQRWPFLVLEYVEGESLAARFRREGPLPVDECARIVLAVAKALESMRQNRIVHRDVKPDNVLLRRNGEVCVIDLSVARDLGDAASITEDGVFLGTPGYASPEQHRRDPGVDWRSDVYNLGCVLYEIAVGTGFLVKREPGSKGDPFAGAPCRLRSTLRMMLQPDKCRRSSIVEICRELERVTLGSRRQRHVATALIAVAVVALVGVSIARATKQPLPASPDATNTRESRVEDAGESLSDDEAFRTGRDQAARIEGNPQAVVGLTDEEIERMFDSMKRTRSRDLVATLRLFIPMMRRRVVNIPTFYLQRYEVTWAQLALWLNTLPQARLRLEREGGLLRYVDDGQGWIILDNFAEQVGGCGVERRDGRWRAKDGCALKPVEGISPEGAAAMCGAWDMRLPTGDEWEYAARGATKRPYPWGYEKPECDRLAVDQMTFRRDDREYFNGWIPACPLPQPGPWSVREATQDVTPEHGIYGLFGNVSEITLPSVPGLAPGVYEVHGTNYRSIIETGTASFRGTIRANERRVATGLRCASDRQ